MDFIREKTFWIGPIGLVVLTLLNFYFLPFWCIKVTPPLESFNPLPHLKRKPPISATTKRKRIQPCFGLGMHIWYMQANLLVKIASTNKILGLNWIQADYTFRTQHFTPGWKEICQFRQGYFQTKLVNKSWLMKMTCYECSISPKADIQPKDGGSSGLLEARPPPILKNPKLPNNFLCIKNNLSASP